MKKQLNVPFYSNTPDNTHCFQAAIKMVLKYFEPKKEYSWPELERLSAKKEGKGTWPTAMLLYLYQKKYDIQIIERWDYVVFAKSPVKYLRRRYSKEVSDSQIKNSDLKQEQKLMKQFIKIAHTQQKLPTQTDIKRFLDKGYLVCCNVNGYRLINKSGYVGHFVVIIGYDTKGLIIHNPGLPPLEKQHVTRKLFNSAWAYPSNSEKNIMAFKKIQ